MQQKIGKPNHSFHFRRIIKLEELNLDPCLELSNIKREDSFRIFAKDMMLSSRKRLSRNSSMPILKKIPPSFKNFSKNKLFNKNNKLFPSMPKISNLKSSNNDSSIFKKRIPSGFIIRNRGKGNNFRNNFYGQYQKYYNIYHVSNNYHVGNFKAGNQNYNKNKNLGNRNVNYRHLSSNFESYYGNKVKTILNKNYIFRYNNSPYCLENV